MRVERVAKSEKKADKFVVSFDEEEEFIVSAAQIADFGLYTGRELTRDEYSQLRKTIELSSAKTRSLRILGSRSLSEREMEKRLVEKGEAEETARETVQWLTENGLINDSEYAASIVSHYSAKGYGPARIKDELFRRGIPREISNEAVSGLDTAANEEAALEYIRHKLRGSLVKDDLRSVANALCRRGYSYEDARAAVRNYVESAGDTGDAG